MSHLTIRRAEPSEAGLLTSIAIESKGHWGYPREWMDRWEQALTITPAYIEQNEVFLADDGDVAGFYAFVGSSRWELDHFWIRPDRMGRGMGGRLFSHAVDHFCRIAPGSGFLIESDPHAEGFYVRMGARRVGEITRNWDGVVRTLPLLEFRAALP